MARIAFKPTSTISRKQNTVSRAGEEVELVARGRHDPCVVPRAVPMVEAMAALVIADQLLQVLSSPFPFFLPPPPSPCLGNDSRASQGLGLSENEQHWAHMPMVEATHCAHPSRLAAAGMAYDMQTMLISCVCACCSIMRSVSCCLGTVHAALTPPSHTSFASTWRTAMLWPRHD